MQGFVRHFCALLLAVPAATAWAERPSFNILEAGYARQRLDNGCVQDGLQLGASAEISDRVFVAGNWTDVESDEDKDDDRADCGSSLLRGSVGLIGDYGRSANFYGAMSLVQFTPEGGDSDMGWGLEGGFRSFVASGLEAQVAVGMVDVGPLNEVYLSATGTYWFDEMLGVYLTLSVSDESTKGLGLGGKISF
jgi:hypothetical protein